MSFSRIAQLLAPAVVRAAPARTSSLASLTTTFSSLRIAQDAARAQQKRVFSKASGASTPVLAATRPTTQVVQQKCQHGHGHSNQQTRGMKVQSSVKRRCEHCKVS